MVNILMKCPLCSADMVVERNQGYKRFTCYDCYEESDNTRSKAVIFTDPTESIVLRQYLQMGKYDLYLGYKKLPDQKTPFTGTWIWDNSTKSKVVNLPAASKCAFTFEAMSEKLKMLLTFL